MKFGNFLLRLTLILLLWPVLLQAEQPEQVDCELIVGDWQGEYRPDNASFLTQDYAFHGAYDESGMVMIDFSFFDDGEVDRHEGYWYCQDNILTTVLVSAAGTPILFQYHILALTADHWRYQLVSNLPGAPLFDAYRMVPSAMTPKFLDHYPRAFFDRLLPPTIEP